MIPYYRLDGPADAPVVVLSNSLGSTMDMWNPQLPELLQGFAVLRYDHRGHGGSATPPGPYLIDDLGNDVVELIGSLGLRSVSFCGLSLGGMVGMWLAAHHPSLVDKLVLMCTSAQLGPAQLWVDRAEAVRAGGTAAIAETVAGRWFTPGFRDREPELTARFVSMIAASPDQGYINCCAAIERLDLRDALPSIQADTLVITGAQDQSTPPEHGRAIAAAIPRARVEILSPAAHLANVEQPVLVNRLLLQHLEVA